MFMFTPLELLNHQLDVLNTFITDYKKKVELSYEQKQDLDNAEAMRDKFVVAIAKLCL